MVSTLLVSKDGSEIIPGARLLQPRSGQIGEPLLGGTRVYIETYGCQMNVADSNLVIGILADAGMTATADPSSADLILINTCAVRAKAEERVFARAQELNSHKRRRRGLLLAITGCMAEHLRASLRTRAPYVDIIAGPDSYRRLPRLIAEARGGADRDALVDVALDKAETYAGLSGGGGDGVSGFVTIQRGCDKFCSFCVVPFTRGRERAVAPDEVLRQCCAYAAAGYRELVLLGQTVNSYRHADCDFAALLARVASVDGIERIRFTSPYPVDFTSAVMDAIAGIDKVCKHVHLPLQSGSDHMLDRMRRGYTVADFRAIVAGLRARAPTIAISTDILSGFSGESEADHLATLSLMDEIAFDSSFMFVYSERDLTLAAKKLPDDVAEEVKKRRIKEIVARQEQISTAIYAAQVGRTERVLIHARAKRNADQLLGRTDGFKAVILPGDAGQPGDTVDVTIERSTMATLFGSLVED